MNQKKRGGDFEVLEVIAASERERDAVIAARKAALKEAKAKVYLAQRNHDTLVAEKKKELEEISDAYSGFRMSAGPVRLYGDRIDVDGTSVSLEGDVEFDVTTSGNAYTTTEIKGGGPSVGGAVVGGLIAGPTGAIVGGRKKVEAKTKVQDDTRLYLTVVSDAGSAVAEVPSSSELELRKLVAEARHLSKTLKEREIKRNEGFAKADKELEAIEADTEEIDLARTQYAEIEADTAEVDAANAAHEGLLASIDPAEISAARKTKLKRALKRLYMVVAYLMGALFILSGIQGFEDGEPDAGVLLLLLADLFFTTATMFLRDERAVKKEFDTATEKAGE